MVQDRVRLGIIGCGLMGRLHAETLKLLPNADVAAAGDIRPDAAHRLVEDYGSSYAYAVADSGEIFGDKTLDGVLICMPHDSHRYLTLSALEMGKHVFVEKPLAFTTRECRDIEGLFRAIENIGQEVELRL